MPVIVSDIAADPLAEDYRELALAHGLRACWSTPIFSSEGKVLGSFAVLSRHARTPTPHHQKIIAQVTHLAAIAIEHKRTETALRESEERFRRMADAIPEVIWFKAMEPEKVLYCSPSFERVWGLSVGKLYENPRLWIEAIHPDDRERVTRIFSRWVAGGEVEKYNLEYRIVRPDGEIRWIHDRGVLSPDGRALAYLASGISTDVTERKRAEEGLRRGDAYLAEAQKLSRTGSFGWNISTGEIIWSAETFCIMGYDETIRPTLEHMLKRVHPEDLVLVQQMIKQAIRDGRAFDFEHRLLMLDGSSKHVHVVAHPSRTASGEVEFVGAVMDITERKRAAEALRASEHLARGQLEALTHTLNAFAQESEPDKLLEHVLRTIVEQTRAHSIAAWNRNDDGARFDLIAVIENDRYQTREEAVHPAGRLSMLPQHHPVWREVLRTGQHGEMEDIDEETPRMRVGSGEWHRVMRHIEPDPALSILMSHLREIGVRSILFVPILIAGEVAGMLAVRFQDKRTFRREEIELTRALAHQAMLVLQLMRLSRQSRQAAVNAERNRMARDIHDTLAQGFTGVIMQLEAATGATTHGDFAEATNRIARASQLARASLGEARRSVRALRPHSLRNGKLFVALEGLLKTMAEGTNLNAEFHPEGDERFIPADFEEGLLRITQEALTNAVKHADARNFRATLSVDTSKIQLRLVDDGCGFDPQQEYEGFGLIGMKERVDRMGGEFIIRAKPGIGTEILVELKNQTASRAEAGNEQS
jgi:PAS domain S-box-containing protein